MISPPNSQRLSTCRRMVFGERFDDARCSMNSLSSVSSCSPGGKSFSSPIHERGHLSRSRTQAETAEGTLGLTPRFTLDVFGLIRAMELITILNHCHHHRGFVYHH